MVASTTVAVAAPAVVVATLLDVSVASTRETNGQFEVERRCFHFIYDNSPALPEARSARVGHSDPWLLAIMGLLCMIMMEMKDHKSRVGADRCSSLDSRVKKERKSFGVKKMDGERIKWRCFNCMKE